MKLLIHEEIRAQSAQDIIKENIECIQEKVTEILLESVAEFMDKARGETVGSRDRITLLQTDIFMESNFRLFMDVLSHSKEFEEHKDLLKVVEKLERYAIKTAYSEAFAIIKHDFLWRELKSKHEPLWTWLPKIIVNDEVFLKRTLKLLTKDALEFGEGSENFITFKNSVEIVIDDALVCGWLYAIYSAKISENDSVVKKVAALVDVLEKLHLMLKSVNTSSSILERNGDTITLKQRKQVRISSKDASARTVPSSGARGIGIHASPNDQDYLLFRPKSQKSGLRRIHSVQEGSEQLKQNIAHDICLDVASEGSITFGVLETSLGTEKRQDIERTFKIYKAKPIEKRELIKEPVKQATKTVIYKYFNIIDGYWEKDELSSTPSNYVQYLIDECLDPVVCGTRKLDAYHQYSVCSIAIDATCAAWLNCILNLQVKFSIGGAKQFLIDIEALQNWVGNHGALLQESRDRLPKDEGFLRCRGAANLLLRRKGEKLMVFNPSRGEQQGVEALASELLVSAQEDWLDLKAGTGAKGIC
ncbi:uncharacterized protein LOC136025167 isoform X3 [Artemia franciscana]|uniref:uncharacterized protein LOC136025167 isoform X3 n=1 Tax=Artemia franciscana TaxID=6661 RepID=UPI0032DB751F